MLTTCPVHLYSPLQVHRITTSCSSHAYHMPASCPPHSHRKCNACLQAHTPPYAHHVLTGMHAHRILAVGLPAGMPAACLWGLISNFGAKGAGLQLAGLRSLQLVPHHTHNARHLPCTFPVVGTCRRQSGGRAQVTLVLAGTGQMGSNLALRG